MMVSPIVHENSSLSLHIAPTIQMNGSKTTYSRDECFIDVFKGHTESILIVHAHSFKAGLFFRTNADSGWNSVYKVFHRIRFCGNEPIGR